MSQKRLPMISFRATEEILEVLKKLEQAVSAGVTHRSRRSIAIRRAILFAGSHIGTWDFGKGHV